MPSLLAPTASRWEIAARLAASGPGTRWAVLLIPSGLAPVEADAFAADLATLVDGMNVERVHVESPAEFIQAARAAPDRPLVATGFDSFSLDAWRLLDGGRSRLDRNDLAVIVIEERTAGAFVTDAPNLWSLAGGSVWRVSSDLVMTSDQREVRLADLRRRYQLSDDDVRSRARAGLLPAEPDFSEWLVLLGEDHQR